MNGGYFILVITLLPTETLTYFGRRTISNFHQLPKNRVMGTLQCLYDYLYQIKKFKQMRHNLYLYSLYHTIFFIAYSPKVLQN